MFEEFLKFFKIITKVDVLITDLKISYVDEFRFEDALSSENRWCHCFLARRRVAAPSGNGRRLDRAVDQAVDRAAAVHGPLTRLCAAFGLESSRDGKQADIAPCGACNSGTVRVVRANG